jgi:hypothetical protein
MTFLKVNLSSIKGWQDMSLSDIIDFCLDNGINTIVNDYGCGLEFELDDLLYIWEDILTI